MVFVKVDTMPQPKTKAAGQYDEFISFLNQVKVGDKYKFNFEKDKKFFNYLLVVRHYNHKNRMISDTKIEIVNGDKAGEAYITRITAY